MKNEMDKEIFLEGESIFSRSDLDKLVKLKERVRMDLTDFVETKEYNEFYISRRKAQLDLLDYIIRDIE